MKFFFFIILMFSTYTIFAYNTKDIDSMKTYRLGEIEITESRGSLKKINKASITELPYYKIQNSDVNSMSDMQFLLPSANIRTNSRGESMLFVRGAGERQLGLFFDGVSMNIPWDNRLDLTFVPTDVIGRIRINKSSSSIFYGSNVIGGAVSIATLERSNPGYGLTLKMQAGEGNTKSYSLLHDGKIGHFNYIANLSYLSSDGIMLSTNAPKGLGNQDSSSSLRSNTDQERLNAYLRGEYNFNDKTTIGLSLSYTAQEKGVAPETFADNDARFWRFPERNRMIVTLNGEHNFSDIFTLKATLWYDLFSQQINDYTSFNYVDINEIQYDDDKTAGTRMSLSYLIGGEHKLSYVFNGFVTTHEQAKDQNPAAEYSQNTISTGLEYSAILWDLEISTGAGIDYNKTPKTGFYPESAGESQTDFAGFVNLKYFISDEIALTGGISRRSRFPTMREQFDEAIGTFVTNPDLKPETGLLSELGFVYTNNDFSVNVVGFYNYFDGIIERIRLSKEQDSLRRRMRVNFSEALITGIDLNFSYNPIQELLMEGFCTYMSIDAEQNGKEIEHLVQKPELLAGMSASYKFSFGLKPQFELEYTGKQFDSDPETDGKFLTLDPALIMNIRIGYSFDFYDFAYTEVFIRLNNITDEYKLSQLGLPTAGRTLFAGVTVRI